MRQLAIAALACAALCFSVGSSPLAAQDAYGCGGWHGHYGYNFNHSGFERPPYFALFPPVYYSDQIIYRPMGISPFAAPPGVIPAEMTVVPAEPVTITNPYFRGDRPAPIRRTSDNDT
jgi:hypothetical protein